MGPDHTKRLPSRTSAPGQLPGRLCACVCVWGGGNDSCVRRSIIRASATREHERSVARCAIPRTAHNNSSARSGAIAADPPRSDRASGTAVRIPAVRCVRQVNILRYRCGRRVSTGRPFRRAAPPAHPRLARGAIVQFAARTDARMNIWSTFCIRRRDLPLSGPREISAVDSDSVRLLLLPRRSRGSVSVSPDYSRRSERGCGTVASGRCSARTPVAPPRSASYYVPDPSAPDCATPCAAVAFPDRSRSKRP